jgi:CBS domain-containing protein
MRVGDWMTAQPITVAPEEPLRVARERMSAHRIRHLPVVDGSGHLVGVITQRDLLRTQISALQKERDESLEFLEEHVIVKRVMADRVVSITPDRPLAEAARMLWATKYGCLPVVDEHFAVVGILTESDFVKWYVDHGPKEG